METADYLFHSPSGLSGREPTAGSSGSADRRNPFKKESFNLTEQSKLIRENPDLAKRMQAAAGVQ